MIEEAIERGLAIEIEKAVETATANAKAELERRVPQIVAGLAIKIMERVSIDRLGNELVIHVRMDKGQS